MNPMQFAIEAVGGQTAAARLCGLSNVAIHKWVKNAALPRTEYTENQLFTAFG
jgi:DNA-binding transcriptional regulator YdaS (Cro superfamily)